MTMFSLENSLRTSIFSDELQRPFAEEGRDPQTLWLDKNENLDNQLHEFITTIISSLDPKSFSIYPDCFDLYQKIANSENIEPESLLLTAGSDGSIRTVFEACINPGDVVLHPDPTFAMYSVYCKMFGAKQVLLEYERGIEKPVMNLTNFLEAIQIHKPKLVCLANPDSPTGTAFNDIELEAIISTAYETGSLILIDEAYYPFYPTSALKWINKYPNLLVTRTFAKAWGLAGLRVGYLAGNKSIMGYMHKVKPMYEVNTVSLRVMEKMIDHEEIMRKSVKDILAGKRYFIDEMSKLGFKTIDTFANFVHVEFTNNQEEIHSALDGKVLYRKSFGQECLKGYTRFSAAPVPIFEHVVNLIKSAIN